MVRQQCMDCIRTWATWAKQFGIWPYARQEEDWCRCRQMQRGAVLLVPALAVGEEDGGKQGGDA